MPHLAAAWHYFKLVIGLLLLWLTVFGTDAHLASAKAAVDKARADVRRAGERHITKQLRVLGRAVCRQTLLFLDHVFGMKKVLSMRSLWGAWMLSCASGAVALLCLLAVVVALPHVYHPADPAKQAALAKMASDVATKGLTPAKVRMGFAVFSYLALAFLGLALVPSLLGQHRPRGWITAIALVVFGSKALRLMVSMLWTCIKLGIGGNHQLLLLVAGLVVGIACDSALVAVVRAVLRAALRGGDVAWLMLKLGILTIAAIAIIVAPFAMIAETMHVQWLAEVFLFALPTNAIEVVLVAAMAVSVVLLATNALVWYVAGESARGVAERVMTSRKVLWVVGGALVTFSNTGVGNWVRAVAWSAFTR